MVDEQARRRRRRAAVLLVALLGVLVLVAAGCGKSADQKANEAYANSVCNAVSSWETQVKSIATSITAGSLSKEGLQSKLAQIQSATASLRTQVKAVPAPSTSDGTAAKQQINKLSTELATTLDSVKSAIAQIPSNASALDIASALAPLAPQVTSLASTADSTVKAVQSAGGSLSDAFKSTDSCKSLTSNG
jgi:phage shock protein A